MKIETPALWAFEEDILTRSWSEWLTAHTSFLKPLHRYEGLLTILSDRFNLSGVDERTGENVSLNVYKPQIEQLYLGFDDTFNAMETRQLGITWVPLRVTFTQSEQEEKLYLITNYHSFGLTDNKDYFESLQSWLS